MVLGHGRSCASSVLSTDACRLFAIGVADDDESEEPLAREADGDVENASVAVVGSASPGLLAQVACWSASLPWCGRRVGMLSALADAD